MKIKIDQKIIWLLLLAVVVLFFGVRIFLAVWNRDVVSIKTAVVNRGLIEEIIAASGNVKAPVYELDSKLGGKIVSLNVKEGQRVSKGQVLAELDNTSRLVAPASGLVAKVNYLVGETVQPMTSAIVITNNNNAWVEAQIDEIDIANVRIGDVAKITSDVYPDKVYTGEVYWITPLAELRKVGGRIKLDEESYVFPCKIKFLGSHQELIANMSVNVDIATRKNDNAVLLPREALVSRNDHTVVFVVKKNRLLERAIEVGIRSFSSVEALSGLEENEVVAVSNTAKLKDKGRIKIEN